jgi:hypothetical protein
MMGIESDDYIKRSALQFAATIAEIDLLLFDLMHVDPIARLAFMQSFAKLTNTERNQLKEIIK